MNKENILKYSKHCCGCGECYNVCPTNAVTMKKNNQGFYYPEVNNELCTNCGKCVKSCSFNKPRNVDVKEQETYVVKHLNQDVRDKSRSGGIFTAISDIVLNNGGVVYACRLFDNKVAKHIRLTTKVERDLCRGSKYIQSIAFDTFKQVEQDLKQGNIVLYTGTGCQISAIKNYLPLTLHKNLLTMDLVCHGVPSPRVWEDYLKWVEDKYNQKAISVDFRDKIHFGWRDHQETIYFNNVRYSDDKFKQLFYAHYIIRDCCFNCPYKNTNREGDISIADCWGVKPDFDDDKGVSLVIINTEKGKSILKNQKKI